jgi:hypothetical protein
MIHFRTVGSLPLACPKFVPRKRGFAIYVNAIVEGFQEAIRKDQRFDWPPLIELLKWAVQKQSNAPPQNGIADEWYWTRNSIARLISMGFESKNITIPFSCRTEVWKILEALCSAPPAIETTVGPESLEEFLSGPAVKPSVSPEQLLAAIRYAESAVPQSPQVPQWCSISVAPAFCGDYFRVCRRYTRR